MKLNRTSAGEAALFPPPGKTHGTSSAAISGGGMGACRASVSPAAEAGTVAAAAPVIELKGGTEEVM
jgi:hypothetical protein